MPKLPERMPPGPSPQEMLPRIRQIQNNAPGFLLDLAHTYGDLAFFPIASLPVYVVNQPEGVRHILQDQHRRYSKDTIQYNALATITGHGLLTSDGPFWLRQRRLAQPAFSRPRLMSLDQIVVPATLKMVQRWEQAARSGNLVDIDQEMMRLALEIVGKALFSIDLSSEASRLTGAVLSALDHIVYRARNIIVPPAFLPTPRNLRFRQALRTLDEAVYTLIRNRRKSGHPGDDLLGIFLQARDEETGEPMNDLQVRDEVLTMLIAGHETVASALTWTWHLLANHPTERDTLRAEVARVLGGRAPTSADLPGLPYTAQVFSEALRLYPPAWVITRRAMEADELLGYQVPTGALIIMSPYVIHRLEKYWDHPDEFLPTRFSPELEGGRLRFSYIPFGGGPRLCIGSTFAAIEAHLILVLIMQRFNLDQPPGTNVQMDALVTLRPHGGMPMRLVEIPKLS